MIKWDRSLTSLVAQTPFVKMRVTVDIPHTSGMEHIRYSASVMSQNSTEIIAADDIADEQIACAWCVEVYANLLHRELVQLEEA